MKRLVLLVVFAGGPLAAQDGTRHYGEVHRTPFGAVLDFHPDGAWRREAARVRAWREAQLAADLAPEGSAGLAGAPGAAVVSGTRNVPAILFSFADSGRATAYDTSQYRQLLFGDPAPPDRPYSMRTYFSEISNGLVTILGSVVGWVQLDSNESRYTGPYQGCPGNPYGSNQCNGIFSTAATNGMQAGLREALTKASATGLDWGQFDNDGPDGVANSGDDDGFVDMVIFVHSERDGACFSATNNHLWSHRWVVSFTTTTPSANGGMIGIRDYTLQAGVGGTTACDVSQVMAIGTASHETGHAFGLPDLYSTAAGSGIGRWGLMGSGNYNTPATPAYMSAWSRAELGWVTTVLVGGDSVVSLSPVETADTVLVLPVPGSSEYFLLENRQRLGSDVALFAPGLLVWHVDSALINQRRSSNNVNEFLPYGLALEQADGANHLQAGTNNGDAGDPFPGSTARTAWSQATSPSSARNNGTATWIAIANITQVSTNGPVSFDLTRGPPLTISVVGPGSIASSSGQTFPGTAPLKGTTTINAVPEAGAVFAGWTGDTSTANPQLQLTATRAWSVTATFSAPVSVAASAPPSGVMGASYQHQFSATGGIGAKVWNLAGGSLPPGISLSSTGALSGVPAATGQFVFTVRATAGSLAGTADHTIDVVAPALNASTLVQRMLTGVGNLTSAEITYLDLLGNRNGTLDLGDFLAWVDATGATPSAAEMRAVVQAAGGAR